MICVIRSVWRNGSGDIFQCEAEYISMTLGDLMVHLDEQPVPNTEEKEGEEPESNEDVWMQRRNRVIQVMETEGYDCRLTDEMCAPVVTMQEEEGEEEWDEGKKYRKDRLDELYPEGSTQRKALGKIKMVPQQNAKGKREIWVYIFQEVEGVKNFKIYKKKSTSKSSRIGDARQNTEKEQADVYQEARDGMSFNTEDRGRLVLPTLDDFPRAGGNFLQGQKRTLARKRSEASSACSENMHGPLGGDSAQKRKKKRKMDEDGLDFGSPQTATPGSASAGPPGAASALVEPVQLDNPKAKAAQAFLKGCLAKLLEVKALAHAWRSVARLDDCDETMLNNASRGLNGKLGKITDLDLKHCGTQYRQWIQRIRSYKMITTAVRQGLAKRANGSAASRLQGCSEIKSAFSTWHAAAKLLPGDEMEMAAPIGAIEVYGDFEFETTFDTEDAIKEPFKQMSDRIQVICAKSDSCIIMHFRVVSSIMADTIIALVQLNDNPTGGNMDRFRLQVLHVSAMGRILLGVGDRLEISFFTQLTQSIVHLVAPQACTMPELQAAWSFLQKAAESNKMASTLITLKAGEALLAEAKEMLGNERNDDSVKKLLEIGRGEMEKTMKGWLPLAESSLDDFKNQCKAMQEYAISTSTSLGKCSHGKKESFHEATLKMVDAMVARAHIIFPFMRAQNIPLVRAFWNPILNPASDSPECGIQKIAADTRECRDLNSVWLSLCEALGEMELAVRPLLRDGSKTMRVEAKLFAGSIHALTTYVETALPRGIELQDAHVARITSGLVVSNETMSKFDDWKQGLGKMELADTHHDLLDLMLSVKEVKTYFMEEADKIYSTVKESFNDALLSVPGASDDVFMPSLSEAEIHSLLNQDKELPESTAHTHSIFAFAAKLGRSEDIALCDWKVHLNRARMSAVKFELARTGLVSLADMSDTTVISDDEFRCAFLQLSQDIEPFGKFSGASGSGDGSYAQVRNALALQAMQYREVCVVAVNKRSSEYVRALADVFLQILPDGHIERSYESWAYSGTFDKSKVMNQVCVSC